tara:strand:- start:296 stop:805 length:510 start_codon:yes stop_codon:yes gene_type:complete
MILSCNSCGKKFVVPDNAITSSGRIVQCGSCGSKWKQFPINLQKKEAPVSRPKLKKAFPKPKNPKRKIVKKAREINLYSPEYLAKKHGIKLNDPKTTIVNKVKSTNKVSFGFYSSLLVFLVFIIFISRSLFFVQDFIVGLFPGLEFYLDYFFESMKNTFEVWKSLVTSY